MHAARARFVADTAQEISVNSRGTAVSTEQLALVPLRRPEGTALVADLSWVREALYAAYWGRDPGREWHSRYPGPPAGAPAEERLRLTPWPLVRPGADRSSLSACAPADAAPCQSACGQPRQAALSQVHLDFPCGAETTFMAYPELVAAMDGVPLRFPEVYFIGDMETVVSGELPSRDPDWFRGFPGLPSRWVGTACELCGATDARPRHVIGPSRIVRCSCGLEYDQPRAIVPAQALDKFASDVADRRKAACSVERAEQGAALLMAGLESLSPQLIGGPLLDVGCASGELLMVLRDRGWPDELLWGIEPSPRSVQIARERHGLNVVLGSASDADLPGREFAIVTLFNTIEHLDTPLSDLRRMARLLQPGGVLLLATVPNVEGLAPSLFPEGFIARNFPDGQHRFQFSPATLTRLCREAGFVDLRLDGETRDPVMGKVAETAAWLAYSCGVPLEVCRDEPAMLAELRDRVSRAPCSAFRGARPECRPGDFRDAESLVRFWRREIWSCGWLSDEFDLWLRANG